MADLGALLRGFRDVRARTVALAARLTRDDQFAQAMPEASPTKWHLGHTTWFFEKMLLEALVDGRRAYDAHFDWVFNSYYEAVGERQARGDRSLLTRPSLEEVHRYRAAIDAEVTERLPALATAQPRAASILQLGMHHEQQHQELLLTDVALVLAPQRVAYLTASSPPDPLTTAWRGGEEMVKLQGGLVEIGHAGDGFAFDNETPRHKVWLEPFELGARLVTQGEWLAFMKAGGYEEPAHWLSDGWDACRRHGWRAPLYWDAGAASLWTMRGLEPLDPDLPVCHVSYYEADAFARWSGARLPTEAEWELAASSLPVEGTFVESERFHPARATPAAGLGQMFGDAWQWTASPYVPYPRFRPFDGALGEYNGKFMCNQLVLRGGSCFSPRDHLRASYRNFFPPDTRWQMTGVRLARWT